MGAPRRLERGGANDGFLGAWTDLGRNKDPTSLISGKNSAAFCGEYGRWYHFCFSLQLLSLAALKLGWTRELEGALQAPGGTSGAAVAMCCSLRGETLPLPVWPAGSPKEVDAPSGKK